MALCSRCTLRAGTCERRLDGSLVENTCFPDLPSGISDTLQISNFTDLAFQREERSGIRR